MPDPLRDSDSSDGSSVSHDSHIEHLLLTGLDHYFSGQHELAISVWTRVLFLDRGHPRARAYIERARGAIAERQREAEELLQTGMAAFQRGDTASAERLLASAVERGVRPEEPLALLERLARLNHGGAASDAASAPAARPRHAPAAAAVPNARRAMPFALVLTLGLVCGAALVLYATTGGVAWPSSGSRAIAPAVPAQDPLPVPSAADVSLTRARTWAADGRLRDALRALDRIRPDDPLRSQADQLRGDIQQRLLAAAHAAPPGTAHR